MINNSHKALIKRELWQDAEDMETMFNWRERYPNFAPHEIACRHCGDLLINWEAMNALQRLRNSWKSPLRILSGYRCPIHNEKVGGVAGSLHLQGRAFDIHTPTSWTGKHTASFIWHATKAGFSGIGLYTTFIHIDTGPHRTWEQGDTTLDGYDRDDTREINPR